MNVQHRALKCEFRATATNKRQFEAKVMVYGVTDDYGTVWQPGVFTESLSTRLPRIAWAHDWTEPLGMYIDYADTADSLTLVGQFDDFDAVPRARQAYAQLQSGTIDQFSVGFVRRDWQSRNDMGPSDTEDFDIGDMPMDCEEVMIRADLVETSPVLVGAVPGTQLVGVRSIRMANGLTVPGDFVIDLGRKLDAGEITESEAQKALQLVAGGKPADKADTGADEAISEAEAILEELGL